MIDDGGVGGPCPHSAKLGVPGIMHAKGSASPSASFAYPARNAVLLRARVDCLCTRPIADPKKKIEMNIRYSRSDILKIPRLLKNNANIVYSFLEERKGGANHPRFYAWPLSRSFFTKIDSPGLGCTNETCCSSMVSCSICPFFSLRVISEGSAFWKERVASAR